jgi:ERCC4-type nuclease
LSHYKSVSKIAKASVKELGEIVGRKMAERIFEYFKQEQDTKND